MLLGDMKLYSMFKPQRRVEAGGMSLKKRRILMKFCVPQKNSCLADELIAEENHWRKRG